MVRYLGNRLLPESARLPTLGAVFAALSYGVAFSNAPGGASALEVTGTDPRPTRPARPRR